MASRFFKTLEQRLGIGFELRKRVSETDQVGFGFRGAGLVLPAVICVSDNYAAIGAAEARHDLDRRAAERYVYHLPVAAKSRLTVGLSEGVFHLLKQLRLPVFRPTLESPVNVRRQQ